MCSIKKNEQSAPQIITPPIVTPPIIAPPIIAPPLQLTPILDSTGTMFIANQLWNGTEYVRTNDTTKFIDYKTDPKFLSFMPFVRPNIQQIISTMTNVPAYDSTDIPTMNVENARPIANFGNSCYFGVGMHLLFVMYDIRKKILSNKNIYNIPNPIITATMNKIKNLLKLMNKSPKIKPITSTEFPDYFEVKKIIMGNNNPKEEDVTDFLNRCLAPLSYDITDECSIKGTWNYYHVKTRAILKSEPNSYFAGPEFNVFSNVISKNMTGKLEKCMQLSYKKVFLQDRSNAVQVGSDYELAYSHFEITHLPKYLLVKLNIIDEKKRIKLHHSIKLNTFLDITTLSGTHKTYFFLGAIFHIGSGIDAGHYRALIYDNRDKIQSKFEYLYYDDAKSEKKYMDEKSKYIISTGSNALYDPTSEIPYLLLYADITQLH